MKYVSKAEKRTKPLLDIFQSAVRNSDSVADEAAPKLGKKFSKRLAKGIYPPKRLRVYSSGGNSPWLVFLRTPPCRPTQRSAACPAACAGEQPGGANEVPP